MTTDSSADQQGLVGRAADAVEQGSDTRPLEEEAEGPLGTPILWICGGLVLVLAGLHRDPQESTGLDGSLKVLQYHPVGVYVLTMIALGLICYGIFAIIRAIYGRM